MTGTGDAPLGATVPGVPAEIVEEVARLGVGPTAPPSRPVVLVGLMASGKTSLGRRVAAALGIPFVDADREIEERAGCTVAEIFATSGEGAFRATEEAVVAALVTAPDIRVIATGGGAVLSAVTRRLLHEHAQVVWLRASPAILAARARPDGSRPLLVDDPRGTLERLARERAPWYEEVADHVIDVDGGDRRVLLGQVLAALERGTAGPGGEQP